MCEYLRHLHYNGRRWRALSTRSVRNARSAVTVASPAPGSCSALSRYCNCRERAAPGIEPRTSRTQSENQTTRPKSRIVMPACESKHMRDKMSHALNSCDGASTVATVHYSFLAKASFPKDLLPRLLCPRPLASFPTTPSSTTSCSMTSSSSSSSSSAPSFPTHCAYSLLHERTRAQLTHANINEGRSPKTGEHTHARCDRLRTMRY